MEDLSEIDIAFLPIGGRKFTMNLSEAVRAAMRIKPKVVIPMHCFEADRKKFKKQVELISDIKVELLQIGDIYHLQ
jgi:L-ascorbate metabolism protein UlaG (beta-lactamase superfamily)